MKIKFNNEMKEKIQIGMAVATFTLVLYFVLNNFPLLSDFFNRLVSVGFPFLLGFALAFLLNPLMVFFEEKVFAKWNCKGKGKRTVSLLLSFAIAVCFIVFLLYLIVPAVLESVSDLVRNSQLYLDNFNENVTEFFMTHHLNPEQIESVVNIGDNLFSKISEMFANELPAILEAGYGFVKLIFNILIGICAALYLLLDKERFHRNVKKINFALLPKGTAKYTHRMVRVCRDIFYDFIVGKAIDSLIIGIICYVGLSLLGIRYAALLSVFVGVTNMIPVFGPFIGGVPGLIILLIVEPIQCLYFVIFVFLLQQFDGNILGPLILGDKLKIASFWILFSVTVGGAFFGVVGMFIGVPTFAFLYFGIKEFVDLRLEKKQINVDEELMQ